MKRQGLSNTPETWRGALAVVAVCPPMHRRSAQVAGHEMISFAHQQLYYLITCGRL